MVKRQKVLFGARFNFVEKDLADVLHFTSEANISGQLITIYGALVMVEN